MPATILVVDDDESVHRLISRRLGNLGFHIVVAEDGSQALEVAANVPIDLVILDIMMPGKTGPEVLDILRLEHPPIKLPVIMVTAVDDGPTVVDAFRRGANDYITKPIHFDLLLKRMRVHLALKMGRGNLIGPYKIEKRLGAGGMGTVFAAVDTTSGQRVALKVLRRALTYRDDYIIRFLKEARLATRLSHPNLVRCLGSGKDDETFFLAMELITGKTARALLNDGPQAPTLALGIARQIASALEVVAASGLIHRDVKPDNIIVDEQGVARLTDFGLAREIGSQARLTSSGVWLGSPSYASPEQLTARGDHRSDIYSLGCTLFALLTGRDPFSPTLPYEQLLAGKKRKPPLARDVERSLSRRVSSLVARMMAPRPAKRHSTFAELVSDIDGLLASLD
jgi:serine/threonine-protein kinase